MRTHVLALVSEAFGGTGGIAQYNRDLFRAMASSDDTEVFVLPRSAPERGDPMPRAVSQYVPVGGKVGYTLGAWLRSGPPVQIVFCSHLHLAPLAYLLARWFGAKFWLQIHGVEAWQEPSFLRRQAADRADLVTAISRYSRRQFLKWARLAPERVRVLPATYHERFTTGPKSDEVIGRYDLYGRKVVLTVGRLSSGERYKGHDRVIRLLPELRPLVPDIAYVVAGDGDDRKRLASLARDLQVGDLVRFIGAVPDRELPALYRTADLFAMPSTGEGFGIAFLEAAASGLPVIGGSRDGSVDALRDGAIGTLVDPDDRVQLRDAILTALKGEASEAAGLRVFKRKDFENHVRSILESIDIPG